MLDIFIEFIEYLDFGFFGDLYIVSHDFGDILEDNFADFVDLIVGKDGLLQIEGNFFHKFSKDFLERLFHEALKKGFVVFIHGAQNFIKKEMQFLVRFGENFLAHVGNTLQQRSLLMNFV